jgi:predicted metal-dependent phosphotriesterase family hydrolase
MTVAGEIDRKQQNPDGYNYILKKVLPKLLASSISNETIEKIMIDNPASFLVSGN